MNITGSSNVATVGNPVYAYNWTNVTETVNNVTFTGASNQNGGTNVTTTGFNGYTNSAYGGGPSSYNGMLAGGMYLDNSPSATVSLNALTAGHQYAVQFWVNDQRNLGRTENLSSAGGNTVKLSYDYSGTSGGYGQYALGYFTSNGTSTTINVSPNNNDVQMNAIQLRDVTNLGYWNGTANNGTWDSNTSANFCTNVYNAPLAAGAFSQATSATQNAYFGDYYYNSGSTLAVSSGSVNIAAGGVSTGAVYFQNNALNYTLTSSDTAGITGSTAVTLMGSGLVTFAGANSYSGATTISSGTLQMANAAALLNSTVSVAAANGLSFALGTTAATLGGLSGGGNFALADGGGNPVTLSVGNNAASSTYSGAMTGGGALTKIGTGVLTLAGANTNSGATTISAGTLQLGNGASVGALGPGSVSDNAALAFNANSNQTFSGTINGTGAVFQIGSGVTTLIAGNTYSGNTTITAGTLAVAGGGSLGSGGNYAGTIANGGALLVNIGGNQTFSGAITGAGVLDQAGNGITTLTLANSYSGGTNVSGGTLVLSGAANSNNGNIAVSNSANLTFATSSGNPTFTKAITGTAGNVVFNVNGNTSDSGGSDGSNFALQNTGAFTGTVIVNTGLVSPNANAAFGATTNVIELNAGSGNSAGLVATGNIVLPSTRGIQLTTAGGYGIFRAYGGATFEIDGTISGPGNFVKTDGGTVKLGGANTFTGSTRVGVGTLDLTNGLALQTSTLISAGITFDSAVSSNAFTIGGLNGSFNLGLANTAGTAVALTVGTNNGNYVYSGVLSGAGSLTTTGSGMLTLSNQNSYTGATTVSGGTLVLADGANNYTWSGGTIVIAGPSTLQVTGNKYNFAGTTFTFNSTGGGTINTAATGGGGFVLTGNDTFATSGGAQDTISGGGQWLNLNGQTATFNVTRGTAASDLRITEPLWNGGNIVVTGNGILALTGVNTYSGSTSINGGTVNAGIAQNGTASGPFGATGTISFGGGTLQYSAANQYDYSARFSTVGNQLWSIDTNGQNVTFATALQGAGSSLTKVGSGMLTLSGNNSYTGGTTVVGGTLVGTGASALGTGGNLTVGGGATFAYEPSAAAALSLGSGSLNFAGGSTVVAALGGSAGQSAIATAGSASIGGNVTLNVFGVPGAAPAAGVNNLIAAAGGGLSGGSVSLGAVYNATNFTVAGLAQTNTAITVNVTPQTALSSVYWQGGFSGGSQWAISDGTGNSNWAASASGGATPLVPGPAALVAFSSAGAVNQARHDPRRADEHRRHRRQRYEQHRPQRRRQHADAGHQRDHGQCRRGRGDPGGADDLQRQPDLDQQCGQPLDRLRRGDQRRQSARYGRQRRNQPLRRHRRRGRIDGRRAGHHDPHRRQYLHGRHDPQRRHGQRRRCPERDHLGPLRGLRHDLLRRRDLAVLGGQPVRLFLPLQHRRRPALADRHQRPERDLRLRLAGRRQQPDQGWQRHAVPFRQQLLYRRHDGQRRHGFHHRRLPVGLQRDQRGLRRPPHHQREQLAERGQRHPAHRRLVDQRHNRRNGRRKPCPPAYRFTTAR